MSPPGAPPPVQADSVLAALPHPVLLLGADDRIMFLNPAAEQFFATGAVQLESRPIASLVPFGSPLLALVAQARTDGAPVSEYALDLSTPRNGERMADVQASPVPEYAGAVVLTLRERTIAQKMDRQRNSRSAARALTGMAAVLAHEIKNPLAGIRGAAQLLEPALSGDDRALTVLIRDEADRIVNLVTRMERFSDGVAAPRAPVNIHEVLNHVRRLAEAGFARGIRFTETYDPSLPPVPGDRDALIQVFLNLVRNAADAVTAGEGEIALSTAYRPGVRVAVPGAQGRLSLPLEVCVRDNGSGVPAELVPHLFDPFVTTKPSGQGLGLALVAKILDDHGGVIECESRPRRTIFRALLPVMPEGSA